MAGLVADVVKRDLLELILGRVNRRTRVRVVEGALALGLVAVAGELVVHGRLDGRLAVVLELVANGHRVAAVGEHIGAAHRHLADRAFKGGRVDVDLAAELFVHALFGLGADVLEGGLVIGELTTDKSRLRHIDALWRDGQQFDVGTGLLFLAQDHASDAHFGPVRLLVLLEQHGVRHHGTNFVDRELEHVVAHVHGLGGVDHALGHGLGAALSDIGHAGGRVGLGGGRLFGLRDGGFSKKRGLSVVDVPVVPQHEAGGHQNHPHEGTLKIASHIRSNLFVVRIRRNFTSVDVRRRRDTSSASGTFREPDRSRFPRRDGNAPGG